MTKYKGLDALFQTEDFSLGSENIAINKIHSFKNHPFKVQDNDDMDKLVASIRSNGIITPVILRKQQTEYELISGHRRVYAANKCGFNEVPAIIKDLTDEEATMYMVASNISRTNILPSEKAKSLNLLAKQIKHQGTKAQIEPKSTCQMLADKMGISAATIKRYIRYAKLSDDWLEQFDRGNIKKSFAYKMSFFDSKAQRILFKLWTKNKLPENILDKLQDKDFTSEKEIESYIQTLAQIEPKETFNQKVNHYFPGMTKKQREEKILEILAWWEKKSRDITLVDTP